MGLRAIEIEVEAGWVAVNGERLPNSATVARDSAGRPLAHVSWGKRQVAADQVWLLGLNNRRSWDSRYFGPVPLGAVRGRRGTGADVVTVMADDRHGREQGLRVHHLANLGGLVALAGLDTGAARFPARSVAEHRARGGGAHR